jgi:hypothetical protein
MRLRLVWQQTAVVGASLCLAILGVSSEKAFGQRPQPQPDVIDFESNPLILRGHGYLHGGYATQRSVDPIAGYLEGVSFTPTGIRGGELGNVQGAGNVNRYLRVEPQTDRHGIAIEFANGGIFDLLSVDVGNYQNFGSRVPATVQFYAGANPPPFTPGVAKNGWALATTPQPGPFDPYQRIAIAESTSPNFPAEQFRGIRRAYIGLDETVVIDNIRAVWSRENFNNGAGVTIHQHTIIGDQIVSDGLATVHQLPFMEASGDIDPIVRMSEERRIFTWHRRETSINELPLVIAGELDYRLVAVNGALASLKREFEICEVNKGPFHGHGETLAALGIRPTFREERIFDGMRILESSSTLKPGVTYELMTRLTLTLDPRGGYAAALMTDGWEVRLGGHLVPEPTGLILLAMAIWSAACCGARRRFSR